MASSSTAEPLLPYVEETNRCMHNVWNQDPGPTPGDICPKYSCYSCCNEGQAVEHYAQGFENSKITHYGPYRFGGCSSTGQHDVTGTGHLSEKCHAFVTNNHCITACSPNVYIWFAKTGAQGRLYDHVSGMKVCKPFCEDFYSACKNDYICFNKEGMKEYIIDLFTGGLSEEKDYNIYHCEGAYECQKIQDSYIAKPLEADIIGHALQSDETGSTQSQKEAENFCGRFSFGMYEQENMDGVPCIDPRYETDIIGAVKRHEELYNSNPLNVVKQRAFPTTDECAVGLSTGAIIGIVVGALVATFGLVGLILFFSKRKSDKEKQYEMGNVVESQPTNEDIVKD